MGRFEKHFEIFRITLSMHCQHASNHNNKHLTEFSLAVWTIWPYSESYCPTKIADAQAPTRTTTVLLPYTHQITALVP
jgi:hypothetical protein